MGPCHLTTIECGKEKPDTTAIQRRREPENTCRTHRDDTHRALRTQRLIKHAYTGTG